MSTERHGDVINRAPGVPEIVTFCGVSLVLWAAAWALMALASGVPGAVVACVIVGCWIAWGARLVICCRSWICKLIGMAGASAAVMVCMACVKVVA